MIENRTAQIVNATPGQLIVITYELIIETLEEAQKQLAVKDEKKFKKTIDKAQKLLRKLMESLELYYKNSVDLM